MENLAKLARIELGVAEKKELVSDLKGILGYVKQIEKVEVGDVETEHNEVNVWREDKLKECDFSKELIIGQFPDKQDGFLKVKKIL